jgi:protein-S-isoprenylcysteine O-methyltransferase Ste14
MSDSPAVENKITPLFALQFCLALLVIGSVVFRHATLNAARVAGLCIAVPSVVLLFTARRQLGSSFSVTPQAKGLVTGGLYSKIRNPIYVFSALTLLGLVIAMQYRYAPLFLLILVPLQIMRAHQEGKVLEAKFGDEYRKYREGTWF